MDKRKVSSIVISSIFTAGIVFGGAVDWQASAAEDVKNENEKGIAAGELAGNAVVTNEKSGSVKVVYTVKNQTPKELELLFLSGLKADYIVYDHKGEKVKQYSDEMVVIQIVDEVVLKQGEELVNEFMIKGLEPGSYSIKLFLNTAAHKGEVTQSFDVQASDDGNVKPAIQFKDVPADFWAKKEIDYLVQKGIITGYKNQTFKPNQYVTNSQAAVMLVRALSLSTDERPNPNFKDVKPSHHAFNEIAAVVDEGIFPKEKLFQPNAPMSREAMARALVNAFKLQKGNAAPFADVSDLYWASEYIHKLAANGITTGYKDGTFKPKNKVTRAQFAVFTARALNEEFRSEQ